LFLALHVFTAIRHSGYGVYMALTVGSPKRWRTLPALGGGALHLQDLQGKKYILFMWASW
jgi:hypothetical protein